MRAYPGLWLPTWEKWQNPPSSSHLALYTKHENDISHQAKRKALAEKQNKMLCCEYSELMFIRSFHSVLSALHYNTRQLAVHIISLSDTSWLYPERITNIPQFWISCFPSLSHKHTVQLTVPCRVAHPTLTSVHAQYPYSFYQPPFPHGSSAHQGHVLRCILAWSVTIAARTERHACWPVIYSDNKQAQMDSILHLCICYKISLYQNMVSWWIYLETHSAPAGSTTATSPADLKKMWPERALFVFPHSVERGETHKSHSEKAALPEQ